VENLAATGIRSPDRPARSQSLYRLDYPAQGVFVIGVVYEGASLNNRNYIITFLQEYF
jgi:hypothetical protein